MQPFPEVCRIFAEFGYFLKWLFLSGNPIPACC